jgi:hypothetical protein
MKSIAHTVFVEPRVYRIWGVDAHVHRERNREKTRLRAEAFINEIGVDNVLSIAEHASSFEPFSIVIWWRREFTVSDALVIRATGEQQSA